MNMPSLKAMPGRVILVFPKPTEKKGAIFIPQTSARRPEFGQLHDIGEPLNEEQRVIATHIRERAKAGEKFPVSFAAGVSYWQTELGEDYEWLKDCRTFRIEELATSVVE